MSLQIGVGICSVPTTRAVSVDSTPSHDPWLINQSDPNSEVTPLVNCYILLLWKLFWNVVHNNK